MGLLQTFDLQPLIDKYNLKIYWDLGTGSGECLNYALKFNFEKVYSVDLDEEFIQNMSHLKDRVELIQGYSTDVLRKYIPLMDERSIVWWIDDHLPYGDFRKISYEESIRTYLQHAFPLEEELKIITNERDISKDVFIIDDCVLVDPNIDCDWHRQGNTFKERYIAEELGLMPPHDLLQRTFEKTHNYQFSPIHQGYFIATPK